MSTGRASPHAILAEIDAICMAAEDGEFTDEQVAELERLAATGEDIVGELMKRSLAERAHAAGHEGRKKHLEAEAKSCGWYASIRNGKADRLEGMAMTVLDRLGLTSVRHPELGKIRVQQAGNPSIRYVGPGKIPDEYAIVEVREDRKIDRKTVLEAHECGVLDPADWKVEYSRGIRISS